MVDPSGTAMCRDILEFRSSQCDFDLRGVHHVSVHLSAAFLGR